MVTRETQKVLQPHGEQRAHGGLGRVGDVGVPLVAILLLPHVGAFARQESASGWATEGKIDKTKTKTKLCKAKKKKKILHEQSENNS